VAHDPVIETFALGEPPWPTVDPYLFCVHHVDAYPEGNEVMGPDPALLEGRDLGMDFAGKDGWRMYHGLSVPGFPGHPHRGFETVTYVRQGFIDHSDSLGATARFGRGDTQWLTAGGGIVHSEMFPLIEEDRPNPLELFQIWLNLPAEDKLVDGYFTMIWDENTPRAEFPGGEVTVIAGALDGATPPAPPPNSWASRPEADVAIWHIRLDPGASWEMPASKGQETARVLYFFHGDRLQVGEHEVEPNHGVALEGRYPVTLENPGEDEADVLLLQGRPIGEPVAQYGPFVMNTRDELQQAFADYQRTEFGGWPFDSEQPVHPRDEGRFARHADGRVERAPSMSRQ
jgi:redox-sensitive bicupin YhaK (pirin superfamily)